MNRRNFLKVASSAAAISALSVNKAANALVSCSYFNYQGIQTCDAGISSELANSTISKKQNKDQWCWAACIQMVFSYYGLNVSQETIVREAWGEAINLPAQPYDILESLNREWVDDNDQTFTVTGDSFTANHVTAAQDLSDDMPLIIGTMGHAMVLTSLRYYRNNWGGGSVIASVVRDPWPNRGRRILSANEWYNTNFLVRIRVVKT